ncbi:MAG: FlgD immunoglobulin-like domain containing protein, partial [Armatimonadota bacterium]
VPGDQDDDGDVDVDDLAVFRLHWGGVEGVSAKGRAPCGTYDANCDLNQDGEVNREDFWMMWYDNAPHHSDWPVGDVTGDAASTGCAVGYPDAAPDAFVGFFDLVAFTDKWHTQEGDAEWDETFDFAGPAGSQPTGPEKPCPVDGKVDFYDLVRFAAAWHTGEGPAQPLDGGKRPLAEVRPTLLIEASPQGGLLPGDEVELQINAADVRDLRAYDFRLLFDSNALEIVECDSEEGGFLESAGGDALFMQDLRQPGVAWLTGSLIGRHRERAPDGDGTLARLRLRIKADATRTTIRLAHGRTLDWSGTLATAAPGEIALDVGALEEGDWRCEVVARCGGRLDRGNYFGVVADPDVRRAAPKRARDGGGPQVVFLTQDGPSSRQYLPPGAARLVYRFAVQHAPPGEDVAVSFPDVSSVPRQMTVRLIDEASQAITSVRTQSTYRYHTGNATTRTFRIEVEPTRRGALLLSGLSAVPTRGRAVSIDFWLSADAAADVAIYNVAGRAVRHLARGQLRAAGRQSVLWDARSDVGTQVPAGTYIIRAAARASDGSKSEAVTSVTLVR